jgi:hypothetical protein
VQDVFNALESKGILSERHVPRIGDLGDKDIVKLYERVYGIVFDAQNKRIPTARDVDPFTFYVGASLRGDTCWMPDCRARKLDFLGRYAALYANEITVPLNLTNPDKLGSTDRARKLLSLSAGTLLQFRPLITQGIIKPAVMRTIHCVHTFKWMTKMSALVHEVAQDAAHEAMKDFTVQYQIPERAPTGFPSVYISGPREFLEHGSIVMTLNEPPKWGGKRLKYDKDGKTELRGPKKLWPVWEIFEGIADNTTFYLAFGRLHGARFLTDLPGETFLLDWLNEDEELAATTSAMRSLTHSVPIIGDLPLATLIRIRREERDSFESYRAAITKIASEVLQENGKLSKRKAHEMLKGRIEPELAKLRREVRYERRRQRKRIVGGLAGLAAGIAIGAFAGLPTSISVPLGGAAGVAAGRILGKAGEVACEHGANLRQQNDLYFLLHLEKAAGE